MAVGMPTMPGNGTAGAPGGAPMVASSAYDTVVSPRPEENQADLTGKVSRVSIAERVLESHKKALLARRSRDLISEKLLLHIDGSGDLQWADILYDSRVEIPHAISEFRKTENLLRLIVDNAVAHHTTMPLRYFAESSPDRQAKQRAIVDMLWANYVAQQQDLNGLFAEAMYMAMCSGFTPVHAYWRDDVPIDWYEPTGYTDEQYEQMAGSYEPGPGMIDCWVGNPFGTVFNRGAKRGSVQWMSYERILSADRVREHFGHMPGVEGLEGTNRIPAASEFQLIAREWMTQGLGIHGDPTLRHRQHEESDEELLVVVCREEAPTKANPQGRLTMIAVPGAVDLRRNEGRVGSAVLLADQPLPGGDFSWTNFYSHHRGSDIHGKPWVEDVDQLQVDLNFALSARWELIQKMKEAPIVGPGGVLSEDMLDLGQYNYLEIEPTLGSWRPRVMEWPASVLEALNNEVNDKRSAIFRNGGYQAASRGESLGSRTPYRSIVALQQADSSIHGPVNMRFRRSGCDFMARCHGQFRAYGDVPWLISITGDEFAHLAEPYIDNTKISPTPPQFRLVNAFGPSPELRAQEILELMQTRGADGQPFLRTDEARRQYPNAMIFDDAGNPGVVQRRRAKTVASEFHNRAQAFRNETGFGETSPQHPWVQQAAQMLFQQMEQEFPRLRDDDLQAHLSTLTEITQDETADPIARFAAQMRQDLYYQWQAQMVGMPQPGAEESQGALSPAQREGTDKRQIAAEMAGRGQAGQGAVLQDDEGGPTVALTAR